MRTILAHSVLWFFGFWLVTSACALGVLIYRAAREAYWRRQERIWRPRFEAAVRRKYPAATVPMIHLIRKAADPDEEIADSASHR